MLGRGHDLGCGSSLQPKNPERSDCCVLSARSTPRDGLINPLYQQWPHNPCSGTSHTCYVNLWALFVNRKMYCFLFIPRNRTSKEQSAPDIRQPVLTQVYRMYYNNFFKAQLHGCWQEASAPPPPGTLRRSAWVSSQYSSWLLLESKKERLNTIQVLISDIINHPFCHILHFKS